MTKIVIDQKYMWKKRLPIHSSDFRQYHTYYYCLCFIAFKECIYVIDMSQKSNYKNENKVVHIIMVALFLFSINSNKQHDRQHESCSTVKCIFCFQC